MGQKSKNYIDSITGHLRKLDQHIAAHDAKKNDAKAFQARYAAALQHNDTQAYQTLQNAEKALYTSMNRDRDGVQHTRSEAMAAMAVFGNYLREKESNTKMPWKKRTLADSKAFVEAVKKRLDEVDVRTWRYPV